MSTHTERNEHFATMRRTPRETLACALFALIATAATTLLAVAPARAAVVEVAPAVVDVAHCVDR